MSASSPKAKLTPLRVVGMLALAALAWFAQKQGWIGGSDSAEEVSGSQTATQPSTKPASRSATQATGGVARIAEAFRLEQSGFMVEFGGTVQTLLADDNEGSRHQKFIVRLSDGASVLVTHNIDLASRVPLSRGDNLQLFGQYEWNDRGGVVHWTHHDPGGRHEGGWIEHEGKRYE